MAASPLRSSRASAPARDGSGDPVAVRFEFDFDHVFRLAALPFGITPDRTGVTVDDDHLTAVFGPWAVRTPIANVCSAEVTGPYNPVKVIGGAHLSFADRGLTFATNARQGACICFVEPVRGIEPTGRLTHPGLTVTVREPAALVELLRATIATRTESGGDDASLADVEQALTDDLHGLTAAELRARARELGITGVSKLSKADLLERLEPELAAGTGPAGDGSSD